MLLLIGCNQPLAAPTFVPPSHTITASATYTPIDTPTATLTFTPIRTFTPTLTSTLTETPTLTETFTPTFTPTPELAIATATQNAYCRWGPSTEYITAGVTFQEGMTAIVYGRSYSGSWYWVRIENVEFNCWVAASTVTMNVDQNTLPYVTSKLPVNSSVPAPTGVSATRDDNKVIISWNPASAAIGLGYLVEAQVCSGGMLVDVVKSTANAAMTILDEQGCSGKSYGTLRVYNKLGYSEAIAIPWP